MKPYMIDYELSSLVFVLAYHVVLMMLSVISAICNHYEIIRRKGNFNTGRFIFR